MTKAADAFRTISEVADDLGIQKHVLRFWEVKFNQIRPMKRGGGRRYYRPEDMELLRGIRQLLHKDGYTIKGVQKILREQGVEAVKLKTGSGGEAGETAAAAKTAGKASGAAAKAARGGKTESGSKDLSNDRAKFLRKVIDELVACRALLDPDADEAALKAVARGGGARPRRTA
ncbi:MAG: MerR family transcriptional regulator [Hyphomicrobiaceae bacterium]